MWHVLSQLLGVVVADPDASIRQAVLRALDGRFHDHLCEVRRLRTVAFALHDEALAVPLLGRLSALNPAATLPQLRKLLLSLHSAATQQRHAARRLRAAAGAPVRAASLATGVAAATRCQHDAHRAVAMPTPPHASLAPPPPCSSGTPPAASARRPAHPSAAGLAAGLAAATHATNATLSASRHPLSMCFPKSERENKRFIPLLWQRD